MEAADEVPAVVARRVDDGRRRELARALHTPKACTPGIAARLDHMRLLLARYRAEATALHGKLVALELAGNDNLGPLRRALIESTAQMESISQLLEARCPGEARLARGTEPLDEWIEQVTQRRGR